MPLPDADLNQALQCAERFRSEVERSRFDIGTDAPLHVTLSLGVTQLDTARDSIQSGLSRADEALYQAKHAGRNRVCFADTPSRTSD